MRPESLQTEWIFRDLTERERAEIADEAVEQISRDDTLDGIARVRQGAQAVRTLKFALQGTTPGKPLRVVRDGGSIDSVGFERDASGYVSDAYLGRIPWEIQVLFATHILQRAYLEAHELEKLALSQLSSGTPSSQTATESAGANAPVEPASTTDSDEDTLDLGDDSH